MRADQFFFDGRLGHGQWLGLGSPRPESTKQMEEKLNFQVPAEGLELVILLHTQY